jgi:antitoxin ParD1/3/4/toxin ParE1/3/4
MMIEACSPRASTSLLRRNPTSLPVKFWSVFSYLIVYDPAAGPVAIVRVLDGRRDLRAILDREAEH